jgi:thymidylate kinase
MIILIEGFSCTGKSSLAQVFSKELDIPVVHFGIPPTEDIYDWFFYQFDLAVTKNRHLIIDRFHLSNFAYRDAVGGGVLTNAEWFKLDEMLASFDTCLLLLCDDPFCIQDRLQKREKQDRANQMDRWQIGEIQQRFFEAMRMSQIDSKGSYQFSQFINCEEGYMPQMEHALREMRKGMGSAT